MTTRRLATLLIAIAVILVGQTACRKGALVELQEQGWTVAGSGPSLELTTPQTIPPNSTAMLKRLRGSFAVRVTKMDGQVTEWSDVPRLTGLTITDPALHDIAFLSRFHQLTRLTLDGTQVSDVMPLAGLGQLRLLSIARTPVRDVTPLAGLKDLQIER